MRSSARAAALASLALMGCRLGPTAILLGLTSDAEIGELDHMQLHVERGGKVVFEQSYELPRDAGIPGTLAFSTESPSAGAVTIVARARKGSEGDGWTVTKTAVLGFVSGHQKLLRLRFDRACFAKTCAAGQTCDSGQCHDAAVDPATLPEVGDTDPASLPPGYAGAGGVGGQAGASGGGAGGVGGAGGEATGGGGAGGANLCGNGVIDPGEACDGDAVGAATCATTVDASKVGYVGCTATCTLDTTYCIAPSPCGNAAVEPGSPWPLALKCATNRGSVDVALAKAPSVGWTVPTNGALGVVVGANGVLYLSSQDGLVALEPTSGKVLWTFPPAASEGARTVAALGKDGRIYVVVAMAGTPNLVALVPNAVPSSNPTVAWAIPLDGAPSPLQIGQDGTLYTATQVSVWAVAATGTVRWQHPSAATSVVLGQDGTVYAHGKPLEALRPEDGSVRFSLPLGLATGPAVVGSDGTIYALNGVGSLSSTLSAISPLGKVMANSSQTNAIFALLALGPGDAPYTTSADKNSSGIFARYPAVGQMPTFLLSSYLVGFPFVDALGTSYVDRIDMPTSTASFRAVDAAGLTTWSLPGVLGSVVATEADGTMLLIGPKQDALISLTPAP